MPWSGRVGPNKRPKRRKPSPAIPAIVKSNWPARGQRRECKNAEDGFRSIKPSGHIRGLQTAPRFPGIPNTLPQVEMLQGQQEQNSVDLMEVHQKLNRQTKKTDLPIPLPQNYRS